MASKNNTYKWITNYKPICTTSKLHQVNNHQTCNHWYLSLDEKHFVTFTISVYPTNWKKILRNKFRKGEFFHKKLSNWFFYLSKLLPNEMNDVLWIKQCKTRTWDPPTTAQEASLNWGKLHDCYGNIGFPCKVSLKTNSL